jgi:hypothetical protein
VGEGVHVGIGESASICVDVAEGEVTVVAGVLAVEGFVPGVPETHEELVSLFRHVPSLSIKGVVLTSRLVGGLISTWAVSC